MPKFFQSKLASGLRVITAPMSGTKTAAALVMVATGAKYETGETSGLSHFIEHMLFKGTKKRPSSLRLTSELDALGAEYNAFTGKEYTGYWIKTAAPKIEAALEIVADMLTGSKLAPEEIERERGVILEEINMYFDNPLYYLEDVFEALLYGDTPAGRDTAGTPETVRGLVPEHFSDYVERQYGPGNTILVGAGAVTPARIERLAERVFNSPSFRRRGKEQSGKEPVREDQKKRAVRVYNKKTDQAHLMLGVRAFPWGHPDRLPAKLLATVLGGSMSSRLFINLREREGLAYYVRTQYEGYSDSGYLATRVGVPLGKAERAAAIILREYRHVASELIPAAELRRVKDMIIGRTLLEIESSDSLAEWYGRQAVLGMTVARESGKSPRRLSAPESFLRELEAVTAADLRRVARLVFRPDQLNLAAIGPFAGEEARMAKWLRL